MLQKFHLITLAIHISLSASYLLNAMEEHHSINTNAESQEKKIERILNYVKDEHNNTLAIDLLSSEDIAILSTLKYIQKHGNPFSTSSKLPTTRQEKCQLLTKNLKPLSLADPHNESVMEYIYDISNYDTHKCIKFTNLTQEEALVILYTIDYMAEALGRNRGKLMRSLYRFETKYGTDIPEYIKLKDLCCHKEAHIKITPEINQIGKFAVIIQNQKSLNSLEDISNHIRTNILKSCSCEDITSIVFNQLPNLQYIKPEWIQNIYRTFPNLKHLALKKIPIQKLYAQTFSLAHADSTVFLDNLSHLKIITPDTFSKEWHDGILTVKDCKKLTKQSRINMECPQKNIFEKIFGHTNSYQVIRDTTKKAIA